MKKPIDIIRLLFISPEVVFLLVILLVYQLKPEWLFLVGLPFKKNGEIWKFLPSLPILFTGVVIKVGGKIRAPLENSSNKLLYGWPLYSFLRNRVLVSIFICILCSIGALTIWLFIENLTPITVGAIYLLSVGISGLTALCIVLALPTLKEILGKYVKSI